MLGSIRPALAAICAALALNSAIAAQTPPLPQPPPYTDTSAADAPPPNIRKIVNAALQGSAGALDGYRAWLAAQADAGAQETLEKLSPQTPQEREILRRLYNFAGIASEAEKYAHTVLGNSEFDPARFPSFILEAMASDSAGDNLAIDAVESVAKSWRAANRLLLDRENLFLRYQEELRRGQASTGTRLAWSLIRVGAAHPEARVAPGSFVHDERRAEIAVNLMGEDIRVVATEEDHRERVRASIGGFRFRTGWAILFQKPLGWMAVAAKAMREAGVAPEPDEEWELMEAPRGLVALASMRGADARDIPTRAFFQGAIRRVSALPPPEDAARMKEEFLAAARTLRDGVMSDETIPEAVRMAMKPILEGAYQEIDSRDYFDNDFCRRLIEADYLESHIALSPGRLAELDRYRAALTRVEAGYDRFAVDLPDGGRLVAVTRPDLDVKDGDIPDVRDPETGESVSRYQWRLETADATYFHSPLPARYLYAFSVMEKHGGRHRHRPVGLPDVTEVWHAALGKVAEYSRGDTAARGDEKLWREAVVMDARGRRESDSGPLGWDFPLFVPVRDDQGDPVLLATANGILESPDFSGVADPGERRAAQDGWLDRAAAVLDSPGKLNLIYTHFFRYCSDSPLPEMPNLIGSHYGLSDTHQTVYQSLDRRWVGRLIGDCDDLAEFFQELAARQGKLAHVMQLPAHAAAGYLEENPDGGYQFIVLQTGPLLRFTDVTRDGAVEKAYRSFEREVGGTHFTLAAVPLLLRFADEDTRTPFVLSARIYWDREYAEKMIQVQEYWHLHTYSAGVPIMEEMLRTDREVGSIKELASLYERVGDYERSLALRREELEAAGADALAQLSVLLDIAQLHAHAKDKLPALDALSRMETILKVMREDRPELYARALSFRSSWAMLLSRLGEPEAAWALFERDVEDAWNREGHLSDTLLRTLVVMYDRMSVRRDAGEGDDVPRESTRARHRVRAALSAAFGKGYFQASDAYNKILSRYYWLGRYGVAVAGRKAGLESLWRDGPYPAGPREHHLREEDLSEADWEWFRVLPRLYLAYGMEMLDRDEYPEVHDPVGARKCLETVRRAMEKGRDFGSEALGRDALVKSDLLLSFLTRDLDAYDLVMTMVRSKDYSSLYDDAAVVFGSYCGLIPLDAFPEWIEAFRRFFPGRQHYFKAAYRAMDKGHHDHAIMLARATARFFPEDGLLGDEADSLERAVGRLREGERMRGREEEPTKEWALKVDENDVPPPRLWEVADLVDLLPLAVEY